MKTAEAFYAEIEAKLDALEREEVERKRGKARTEEERLDRMTTDESWFAAEREESEHWDGPYPTREDAARETGYRYVARGKKPDPESIAQCIDLDEICERIDGALSEEWWSNDEPLMEIRDRPAAEAAMVEWVRQHLGCTAWTIDRTTIEQTYDEEAMK